MGTVRPGFTLTHERIRCGKKRCSCRLHGQEHGPYWYLYGRLPNGRKTKVYLGTRLPWPFNKFVDQSMQNGKA